MGKKTKKKNNNRMPVSASRLGGLDTSSSEDSETQLREVIAGAGEHDEQTTEGLSDNMSVALPLPDVDGESAAPAKPQEAVDGTGGEGAKEVELFEQGVPKPTPTIAEDTNETAETPVDGSNNTSIEGQDENKPADVVTTDDGDANGTLTVGENESSGGTISVGDHSVKEDAAPAGGTTREKATENETGISNAEVVSTDLAAGFTGGLDTEATDAEGSTPVAEAVSIEEAVLTEKTSCPGDASAKESTNSPEALPSDGVASEEIPAPDGAGVGTTVEQPTSTEGAITEEAAVIGEAPESYISIADNNIAQKDVQDTGDASASEVNAPVEESVAAEETAVEEGFAIEDQESEHVEGEDGSKREAKSGTTTDSAGASDTGNNGSTELEPILDAVDPEVGEGTDEQSINGPKEVDAVFEEVEPELHQTNDDDLSAKEVDAVLDEVTPNSSAEDEDENVSTNTESTGGQAQGTDDAASDEVEITPSEVTAPTTARSSVCGDSTASEDTAATEDTVADNDNADKDVLTGEDATTVGETPSTEAAPPVEDGATVDGASVVAEPTAEDSTPSDDSQDGGEDSYEEPPHTEGPPAVEETDPATETTPTEEDTANPPAPDEPAVVEETSVSGDSAAVEEAPSTGEPAPAEEETPAPGAAPVIADAEAPSDEGETPAVAEDPPAGDPPAEEGETSVAIEDLPAAEVEAPAAEVIPAPTERDILDEAEAHLVEEQVLAAEADIPPANDEASPTEEVEVVAPEEEMALPEGEAVADEVAVEDGPPLGSVRDVVAGNVPPSPSSRRKLSWLPENADETILEHILRPHRARRESDASVFTVKLAQGHSDSPKHHRRRRESGASGHSKGDHDMPKKKGRTPEEEEERRKRKENMTAEEREERKRRKEAKRSPKDPDQFSVGSRSLNGEKAGSEKSRHRHERRDSESKPQRPRLSKIFSDESVHKVPLLFLKTGVIETEMIQHIPSSRSHRQSHQSHRSAEQKEAHQSKREARHKREAEEQEAREREAQEQEAHETQKREARERRKEEKRALRVQDVNLAHGSSSRHRSSHKHDEREHRRSSRHKELSANDDSPTATLRKMLARKLNSFFY